MTKLPRFFLAIALITLLVGFTDAGSNWGWGILKPLSAIFFILFFITQFMAQEVAAYDQERQSQRTLLNRQSATTASHTEKGSTEGQAKDRTFAATTPIR